jgi:hypothetical protein
LRKTATVFAIASFLFFGLLRLSPDVSQCFPFMDRQMIGLVALDEILRFLSRSVVHIALDPHIRNNFLDNDAANSPSFRIPFNVVAAPKYFEHRFCLHNKKSRATISLFEKFAVTSLVADSCTSD